MILAKIENKSILIGFVITISLIVLIWLRKSPKNNCELVSVEPEYGEDRIKSVVSADNRALVVFGAYLEYEPDRKDDKSIFMPLTIDRVTITDYYNSSIHQQRLLTLYMDCAIISMTLTVTKHETLVDYIALSLTRPTDHGFYMCGFEHPGWFSYKHDKHLTCQNIKIVCGSTESRGTNEATVIVHLKKLEFEIDNGSVGKNQKIRFDKPEQLCHVSN